ncbi:electron transport complex subunit RsxC [Pantoea coffeiphila]|uniref:Ion-translocating oxidoreductase complex subunit C n=1 Tax=Pantoea coffeiphila TaxID=1465635 RepID=A0A2S9I5X4_9GAMM|nr:electron transport complex subunit RsxC [Pantoea coffeiphila]PRD13189.1 electron transport complex subunit RsxC [Pantoea coffeiphila]
MLNLFKRFKKDAIWDFDGGIHPPEMKTQSNGTPLRQLPLPARFILPLKQHIGSEGEISVRPGDKVLRGEPLTFGNGRMLPIHAPTSGTVTKIAPHMTAHPSALAEMCIFIEPDGEDRWCEKQTVSDYRQLERTEVVARVHKAGVAGLGGAGFPTATKLRGGLRGVNTLIINAAECEPYITADDRLMQDCAAEVLEGSRILAWILNAERVLIGIEDNKPEAIAALKAALGNERDLQIRVIPTKYPSGGAKQLTRILTGKEVPHGGRSTDIGVLMQNVGTAFAVKRAVIDGEPLTERVVTLTGEAVKRPGNVWGRIGTPISHLLQQADFEPGNEQMVVMGGPLMGFTLPSLDVPVVKITNCILAPSASEMGASEPEKGCIRCSACADACPAGLLPQQLYWYSRGGDHDKARAHNIADCIECGACAYVCPSNIPLVQYYRQEKAEIQAIDLESERNAQAKARFEARQLRLEREKQAREAKHQQAKRTVAATDADALNAARERVKAKQQQDQAADVAAIETNTRPADDAARAALREARLAEAKARQAEKQAETEPATRQAEDPRKAAVAAAIARAKAKQAAQAGESVAEAPAAKSEAVAEDPRKAAVAAAIARAKAKKAAQVGDAVAEADTPAVKTEPAAEPATDVDPRKAAVAAAIARAKAKKAAQAGDAVAEADTPAVKTEAAAEPATDVDPRKAAVAAAIARAKAKKAAQAGDAAEDAPVVEPEAAAEPVTEAAAEPAAAEDPRKAAIAAAIARAKAKKAAHAGDTAEEAPAVKPEAAAEPATEVVAEPAAAEDPRKAAIAAAIARAKAKKAAQAGDAAEDAPVVEPEAAAEPVTEVVAEPAAAEDPRKAAIAAAIARAKAKKAAQAGGIDAQPAAVEIEQEAVASDDARKAAVAAAIARVKARKAQQPSTQED